MTSRPASSSSLASGPPPAAPPTTPTAQEWAVFLVMSVCLKIMSRQPFFPHLNPLFDMGLRIVTDVFPNPLVGKDNQHDKGPERLEKFPFRDKPAQRPVVHISHLPWLREG